MNKRKHFLLTRFVVIIVVLSMVLPINAKADSPVVPRASYYFDSYNTYLYPAALGKIQVWFSITGVTYMDDIGALTIQIYESKDQKTWSWVKTYNHDSTSNMLTQNDFFYSSHVEYAGTIGRYYKAYVCLWAGKDGDGDTRYMWTDVQKATLLAG